MKAGANQALGIIETAGRAPLIEAVDSAIKAAAVTLKSSYFVGGGVNTVTLVGDVGAMRAALDAAKATINRMGAVGQTHLIPRLADDVWPLVLDQTSGRGPTAPPRDPSGSAKPKGPPKQNAPAATPAPSVSVEPSASTESPAPPALVEPPVSVEAPAPPGETGVADKNGGVLKAAKESLFPDEMAGVLPKPASSKLASSKKKTDSGSVEKKPRNKNPKSGT